MLTGLLIQAQQIISLLIFRILQVIPNSWVKSKFTWAMDQVWSLNMLEILCFSRLFTLKLYVSTIYFMFLPLLHSRLGHPSAKVVKSVLTKCNLASCNKTMIDF
ncbi:hypothetical protein PanWU01x14_182580, partial [Parasponia andersonii]